MSETVFLGACPVIRPEGIYFNGRRVIRFGLEGVERANPLPVGKYWVDVFAPKEAAFQDWLARNKGNVVVTTTESFDAIGDYPARVWRLFEVRKTPVMWEGPGLPNVATPDIKSSADTGQRPPPEKDPLDQIDALEAAKKAAEATARAMKTALIAGTVVAVIVGGVLIAYYVPRQPRRKELPA
jgi:hypothetical protein